MNDETELEDSQNLPEDDAASYETGASDDDYSDDASTENDDDMVHRIAKLEEQNKRLYARLKKQDAKKDTVPSPAPEPKAESPKQDDSSALKEDITRYRLEAKGYNEDEQEIILKASKVLGMDPIKAAADDFVQARITAMREEAKVNNAIPAPSGKAGSKDTNSVDYYLESGEIPEDDELADKVDAERLRRARGN
jgi:hypothetical protein